MAMRLADSVLGGYFNNLKGKSTHGVLALKGYEDPPIIFGFAGDPDPSLAGRSFEFHRAPDAQPPVPAPKRFAPSQIGAVGSMELRMAKVIIGDLEEILASGRKPEFEWKPLLYLEWYSQNGRVVIELPDPILLLEEGQPFPELDIPEDDAPGGLSVTELHVNDKGEAEVRRHEVEPEEVDAGEDDIDSHLARLNSETEAAMRGEEDLDLELELGERLMMANEGEFLASLLEPQQLPPPADVDEPRARALVMSLIAQLALRNVAVHLCPHCSYQEAYRYILEEIVYTKRVPLELQGSGWTMNYDYGEDCPQCQAEVEEDYRDFKPRSTSAEDDEESPS